MTGKDANKIGWGILTAFAQFVILLWIIRFLDANTGLITAFVPRDATDPVTGPRSGVEIVIDHGTGCQYLKTVGQSITPRMGPDGKQICSGDE